MDPDISIRAHYERFPATVKGAFVLRGEGRDPHQVRIEEARVVESAGGGSHTIDLEPVTLEVAPHLDLFVPFEFPVTELGAGWYSLECDVVIDAVPGVVRPGPRFPVAWPRATMRRGTVPVSRAVETGAGTVKVEQIECGNDSIKIVFAAEIAPTMRLSADGADLTVIGSEFDERSGKGRLQAYPLLKTQSTLSIEVKGAASRLDVSLP
jgi:hypothetical protein